MYIFIYTSNKNESYLPIKILLNNLNKSGLTMKKIKYLLLVVCIPLITSQSIAQKTQLKGGIQQVSDPFFQPISAMANSGVDTLTWSDGNPSFQRTVGIENISIDSVVTLIPTLGFMQELENFQFILNVIDSSWAWPTAEAVKILNAEDIEYYTDDDGDHYVVTDVDGGKVVDLVLSAPERAWIFKGDTLTLNNPVDTYVYKIDDEPFFLITDQSRHRVIKVDRYRGTIKWQYGDGSEGSGFNQLYYPSDAVALPAAGQVLICDKGNNRIILVNESDATIAWQWGSGELNRPVDMEYNFDTGEILITDQGNNRVIMIESQTDTIIWQYDIGLDSPSDADFLNNGNILICDKNNNRLIEVDYNKQIIWQSQSPLMNSSDADRLSDNKHLIIMNGQPYRIGYITREYISEAKYLGREVSFDSLYWFANTSPGLTSIQLQFRSENTLSDLASATWYGPTETTLFYTNSISKINPVHNGHKFYQFKATLQTSDPLYTPVLNNVKVAYRYFDPDKAGKILSNIIKGADSDIITRWLSLKFNTILPPNPANRDKVEIKITILDGNTDTPLRSFFANKFNASNEELLENIESLKLIQSIRLQAELSTISTAATPVLNDWDINWESTPITNAQIYFADKNYHPTSVYHAPRSGEDYIDYVTIKLVDQNLVPVQTAISLTITSLSSQDSEPIILNLQQIEGWYRPIVGIPIVISDSAQSNDGIFQVHDRDHLVVTYIDPMVPTDQASDTVLIVKDTKGTIEFLVRDEEGLINLQNNFYTKIDSASIGDTIYVHITGEKDQDLTNQQDILSVVVFNFETTDEETLSVFEIPDDTLEYDTGEFISTGLRLVKNQTWVLDDSLLQSTNGSRVSAKYEGTISRIPIIRVYGDQLPIPTESYTGTRSLDFDVAPNPFYGDKHNLLRIRIASAIGDLTLEKIEIYNFAGQKIADIDGTQLRLYYNDRIVAQQYSYADGWWDLRDQNSIPVSSGTYWIKIIGKLEDTDKHLSHIKKLVIVR